MSLDPYRLPRAVLPQHYSVTLEPELDLATFAGTVRIEANVVEDIDQIVMNAIELDVQSVTVNGAAATFSLDVTTERLFVDAPLSAGATPRIEIAFTGILNDKLRGFYRSTYTDDAGAEH